MARTVLDAGRSATNRADAAERADSERVQVYLEQLLVLGCWLLSQKEEVRMQN